MDRWKSTPQSPDLSAAVPYRPRDDFTSPDETLLIDLWLVLLRRKWLIAAVAGLAIASGIAYASLTPPAYAYKTIIGIGSYYSGAKSELIEPPETLRPKVAEGYVVQALQEEAKNQSGGAGRYRIKVELPKNSQVLILSSVGGVDTNEAYAALHTAVVDRVRFDHDGILDSIRKELAIGLSMRERSLAQLKEAAAVFEAQLKAENGERNSTMRDMSYLASLRLADNQRAQSDLMTQIDSIRQQQASIRETRAVVPPTRSLDPVGFAKRTIVLLSGLIGLAFGVVLALVIEFLAKARQDAVRDSGQD